MFAQLCQNLGKHFTTVSFLCETNNQTSLLDNVSAVLF